MPINPTTLKALIDAQITNETVDFSITPAEVGGRMKDTIDYTTEQIAALELVEGPQGPQGVQGPAGPIGPVGPAGLNWEGSWVSGTSYLADDAVGYDGASWFCILATSGTTTPDIDTTHWALLASQGAQGIQGVQGPTGAQGAVGPAGPEGPAGEGATQTLQQTIDLGNTITNGFTTMSVAADTISAFDFLGGLMEISTVPGDVNNPYIKIGLPASSGKTVILTSADTQSADRIIKLPDASGTIALRSSASGTFTSVDGKTITVTNGIITSIV